MAPNRAAEESWVRVEKIWKEKVTIVLRQTIKCNDEEHSVMIRKLVQGPYQCYSSTSVINSQCPSIIGKLVLSCWRQKIPMNFVYNKTRLLFLLNLAKSARIV